MQDYTSLSLGDCTSVYPVNPGTEIRDTERLELAAVQLLGCAIVTFGGTNFPPLSYDCWTRML